MKKITNLIFYTAILLAVAVVGLRYWTKQTSPSETVKETSDKNLEVSVEYSKPSMNGRKVFGELVPYDIVWRTGANEATIINFSENCSFGNIRIKKGKYSLWTIPNKENWQVILNNETGQWGTNYDESKNLAVIKVAAQKNLQTQEKFKINLSKSKVGLDMKLSWENTLISIPIK